MAIINAETTPQPTFWCAMVWKTKNLCLWSELFCSWTSFDRNRCRRLHIGSISSRKEVESTCKNKWIYCSTASSNPALPNESFPFELHTASFHTLKPSWIHHCASWQTSRSSQATPLSSHCMSDGRTGLSHDTLFMRSWDWYIMDLLLSSSSWVVPPATMKLRWVAGMPSSGKRGNILSIKLLSRSSGHSSWVSPLDAHPCTSTLFPSFLRSCRLWMASDFAAVVMGQGRFLGHCMWRVTLHWQLHRIPFLVV